MKVMSRFRMHLDRDARQGPDCKRINGHRQNRCLRAADAALADQPQEEECIPCHSLPHSHPHQRAHGTDQSEYPGPLQVLCHLNIGRGDLWRSTTERKKNLHRSRLIL